MNYQFMRPENALKHADELSLVGHDSKAVKLLHSVLTAKRPRQWQASMEDMTKRFLELCIKQRNGKLAKDGLYQYRALSQQNQIQSFENVVRYFLEISNKKAEEAREAAKDTLEEIVDDLDEHVDEQLTELTGEDLTERTDRLLVVPWLKLLWENYRTVLDLLKSNPKVEELYQECARETVSFCIRYQRRIEFKRLCEILRTHFANLLKYQNPNHVNVHSSETQMLYLETRFEQLSAAVEMQLWQECFKIVEDIHNLMGMMKRQPKPSVMINYYDKLATIFWTSKNYLFHAAAKWRIICLSHQINKAGSKEDQARDLAQVILAAMSVMPRPEQDGQYAYDMGDKNLQLASLLGFNGPVSRQMLLEETGASDIHSSLDGVVSGLFVLLEEQYSPLNLCGEVNKLLVQLDEHPTKEWHQYGSLLREVAFVRTLQQLHHVYSVIRLEALQKMVGFKDRIGVETSLLSALKQRLVEGSIDNSGSVLRFGSERFSDQSMSQQLGQLSRRLHSTVRLIREDPTTKAEQAERRRQTKLTLFSNIAAKTEEEHQRVLGRIAAIEQYKIKMEKIERLRAKVAEEDRKAREEKAKEELERQRVLAEQRRQEQLEEERRQKEEKAKEKESNVWAVTKVQTTPGGEIKEMPVEDPRKTMREQIMKLAKEKRNLEDRMKKLSRRIDHFERAKLEEEQSLLKDWFETQKFKNRDTFNAQLERFKEEHRRNFDRKVEERRRLAKCQSYRKDFQQCLQEARESRFEKAKADQERRMEPIRRRIAEEKERKKREDEERQAEEERLAREREEQEEREAMEAALQAEQRREDERRRREEESTKGPRWSDKMMDEDEDEPSGGRSRPTGQGEDRHARSDDRYVPPVRSGRRDEDRPSGDRWGDRRRDDDREERRGGFGDRREERGGFDGRREERAGFGDRRGGFGDRREDRGGFGERRGGFGERREDRGGFGERREDRGGFGERREDRGGFGERREDRGGFGERREDRGGFGERREDRGGFGERREDRGGFGERRSGYGEDRGDRRGGFGDNRGDRRGFGGERRGDFGDRRSTDDREERRGGFGDRRGFGDDRGGERRGGFGERRGGFGDDRSDRRGGYGDRGSRYGGDDEKVDRGGWRERRNNAPAGGDRGDWGRRGGDRASREGAESGDGGWRERRDRARESDRGDRDWGRRGDRDAPKEKEQASGVDEDDGFQVVQSRRR